MYVFIRLEFNRIEKQARGFHKFQVKRNEMKSESVYLNLERWRGRHREGGTAHAVFGFHGAVQERAKPVRRKQSMLASGFLFVLLC